MEVCPRLHCALLEARDKATTLPLKAHRVTLSVSFKADGTQITAGYRSQSSCWKLQVCSVSNLRLNDSWGVTVV